MARVMVRVMVMVGSSASFHALMGTMVLPRPAVVVVVVGVVAVVV